MNKSSDEKLRNEIIGLGKNSIRKNYYRSLVEKQKALEQKNVELKIEVNLRKEAEKKLSQLNEELEERISERTMELDESNQKLKMTISNLEKSYDYLIEAEKLASLNHLVNGISHELNTPIGVSLTTASFVTDLVKNTLLKLNEKNLKRSELLNTLEQLDKSSGMLLESIKQMTELTRNFKKISVVQDHYRKFDFSVYEYFQMVIKSMQTNIAAFDKVLIRNNCNKELIIDSYPGIYSQLLTTFLNNTFVHGFSQSGGIITIDFYEDESSYYFKYSDDGKGMEVSLLTHVFEPFFSTNMSSNTPGLGLFAAYNLVANLAGNIKCFSSPGKGFAIEVTIPRNHRIKKTKKGM
ncbi:MAG: HAMP domain-containing histidine kinase [Clostridiales bacterium]|nr:HAMP domain-containing histidine kinase [Clostridiales bacterium]